uniref:Uncharacterized protein n=1 Tax=Trichobilharzia regenti TaxID=157069 RepID=A0AA85IRI5_TRIRE|nr:unnamed protein product [Trichobilharzia regenti]
MVWYFFRFKGTNRRKHNAKSSEISASENALALKASKSYAKTKSITDSHIKLSGFRFDFLKIPTLVSGKKHFDQYLIQTSDEIRETHRSQQCKSDKANVQKSTVNLKKNLYDHLFDEAVMKAELKNVLFLWAKECEVEISKLPLNKIDHILNCSNTIENKVQLQAIVSIGLFESKFESIELDRLRDCLLYKGADIILAICLCLTIMGYSDPKCIEKLYELITLCQNSTKTDEAYTSHSLTISYTSLNLMKWAAAMCLAKLNQCNLEIINILTRPLFDQLVHFIPEQYPNNRFKIQTQESDFPIKNSADLKEKRTHSFVSNLSNMIKFDLNKRNTFLNAIVYYSEVKMVLRLSRDNSEVEDYLTELLTSPNWRIRLCSCWLLSVILCKLSKNTLTRINRLLLLDWNSMLRIAALHSLQIETNSINQSLLWCNRSFNDPFLLNNIQSYFKQEGIHKSSLTSESMPHRRAQRLYQLYKEGLPSAELVRQLHIALLDEYSCVREMACVIIKQEKLAGESIILNELLKNVKNDVNSNVKLMALRALKTLSSCNVSSPTSECIQNQLCDAVQCEMNSYIRQKLFHLLLWFIETRFITCDTSDHLNNHKIDLLAKESLLNEYNSLIEKSVDFNKLFDIQDDVIHYILNSYDQSDCLSPSPLSSHKLYSNAIREALIPNYDKSINDDRINQMKRHKLPCEFYSLYNSLKNSVKYDQCEEIRSELSKMIEPIFSQILERASENAPENCYYSYDNDFDLLRALIDEKCKDLVKICHDIIQYS